jgi:ABC-type polysaccharide/polyol phosphate export permease
MKYNTWQTIWLLSKVDYKLRYYENKLGILWALFKPLSEIIIYFIAFKFILNNNDSDFLVKLFLGQLIWNMFGESTGGMVYTLQNKKYLYEYASLNKLHIYYSQMLTILRGFAFNFSVFLFVMLLLGYQLHLTVLWFPILMALNVFLFLGMGIILSNLYLILRDIQQIWAILSFALYWVSPVIFKADLYLQNFPSIVYFNPMFGVLENMRKVLIYGENPDMFWLLCNSIHACLLFGVGYFLLYRLGKRASELL